MSVCRFCDQEMLRADGCRPHRVIALDSGAPLDAVPYGDPREGWESYGLQPGPRCRDCNVVVGQPHHPGCDMERCPVCGFQAIVCGHCGCRVPRVEPTLEALAAFLLEKALQSGFLLPGQIRDVVEDIAIHFPLDVDGVLSRIYPPVLDHTGDAL